MRRLSVITRLLGSVLLVLAVRMLITGPALSSAVLAGVIAGLLLAAIWLRRRGHEVEPTLPPLVANGRSATPRGTPAAARRGQAWRNAHRR